jgi:cytochrome c556
MTFRVRHFGGIAMFAAACAALASLQQASGAESRSEAEGIIFERQLIMTQLDEDSELLGDIVAGLAPASKLAETASKIAKGARDSVDSFKAQVPGGRSKPEVWSNNADFTAKMESFARNAEAMAELAKGGNVNAVSEVLAGALPCKQCHDVYRAPKSR